MESKDSMRWTKFYLRALREPINGRPFTRKFDALGEAELYVFRDKNAPSRWAYMRAPRILVDDRVNNNLSGYAAVFLCDNPQGNHYLAELENPAHDRWHQDEARNLSSSEREEARLVLKSIRDWVGEVLKEIRSEGQADEQDIVALGDFLPAEDDDESDSQGAGSGTPTEDGQDEPETGLEQPAMVTDVLVAPRTTKINQDPNTGRLKNKKSKKKEPAVGGDGPDVGDGGSGGGEGKGSTGGGPTGGTGAGDGPGGAGTGPGSGGDDTPTDKKRVREVGSEVVTLRSFSLSSCDYRLVLHADADCRGTLALNAVGEDSRYKLALQSASSDGIPLKVSGSEIHGIELSEGEAKTIDVVVDTDVKLCLGIA